MTDIIEHYDMLVEEENDPVFDPEFLRDYMDRWDGEKFIESMKLDKRKYVLEVGVGTGRLAIKVAPQCQGFVGIDISPKTVDRARKNLSLYRNVKLICGDFTSYLFTERFDVIYSSLTFMHINNKLSAIQKIASLLNDEGLFVLSIDKNQNKYIDMGTRKIKIYPDNPKNIYSYMLKAKLEPIELFETESAYVTVGKKPSPAGEGGPR